MPGGGGAAPATTRWNHNTSFHDRVLAALAPGTEVVLDAGSGEGDLARRLVSSGRLAVGLERDRPTIDLARSYGDADGIAFVAGDLLDPPFPPASFDAVVSIAVIHHVDEARALSTMAALLRPGGQLVVIGLAKPRTPVDVAYAGLGFLVAHTIDRNQDEWMPRAPIVWPPPSTFGQLRRLARRELPGATLRRHVRWRYSLTWTKPG